jgi:hypothetical protein
LISTSSIFAASSRIATTKKGEKKITFFWVIIGNHSHYGYLPLRSLSVSLYEACRGFADVSQHGVGSGASANDNKNFLIYFTYSFRHHFSAHG